MKKNKRMGIWMDHSYAYVMELINDTIIERTVISEFKQEEKEHSQEKDEKYNKKKEHYQQSAYYNKLGDAIINYQDVILFGPTDAKNELLNLLRTNHLFDKIKIELRNSDKLTPGEMHDFVREYFKPG